MNDTSGLALPADDAPMVMGDRPVENSLFPFTVINADRMPELLTAFAQAQAGYGKIVRDKLVVQRLKDKESGAYSGREITFKYAELSSILDAVIPSLSGHGLSLMQPVHQSGDGTYLYTILSHKSGCMLITKIKLAGGEMKAFGSEITYIRRYMAGPMLGVSAEDDADNDGQEPGDGESHYGESSAPARQAPPQRRAPPQRKSEGTTATSAAQGDTSGISAGQLANLRAKVKAANLSPDEEIQMLARIGVTAIDTAMSLEDWKKVRGEVDRMVGG